MEMHNYTLPPEHVLCLGYSKKDDPKQWNLNVGSITEQPFFGYGSLSAWEWARGDLYMPPDLLVNATWVVLECFHKDLLNNLGRSVTPCRAKTIAVSSDPVGLANFIRQYAPEDAHVGGLFRRIHQISMGTKAIGGHNSVVEVGDWSTAVALHFSTAIAGAYGSAAVLWGGTARAGNWGSSSAGRGGTAIAGDNGIAYVESAGRAEVGADGMAIAAGNSGRAKTGDRGAAIVEHGIATVGVGGVAAGIREGCVLHIGWIDSRGTSRLAALLVGENGIEPNAFYAIENGRPVKKVEFDPPSKILQYYNKYR